MKNMKQEKKNEARSTEHGAWKISNIQCPISESKREQLIDLLKSQRIASNSTQMAGWRIGQGGGFCIGKGPPGRTRSPVTSRGHPPAVEERPPENKAGPPNNNFYDYNKEQLIFKKTKFNLLQTFNL